MRAAKFAHRVLNTEAGGDFEATIQIVAEGIQERAEIEAVPLAKRRDLAKYMGDEIKLLQDAMETVRKLLDSN